MHSDLGIHHLSKEFADGFELWRQKTTTTQASGLCNITWFQGKQKAEKRKNTAS